MIVSFANGAPCLLDLIWALQPTGAAAGNSTGIAASRAKIRYLFSEAVCSPQPDRRQKTRKPLLQARRQSQ
jgi:hypothetical protein